MAVTRVTLNTVISRCISALNANTAATYSTTVADDRRASGEISAAVLAADAQVCLAICETEGHGYRSLFMALSSALAHGDVLPDHIGAPGQVRIEHAASGGYKAGKFDKDLSLADIENWRANVGSLYGVAHDAANSSTSGFYIIVGGEIYFTGAAAKVQLANFTRSGSCQAPEVYEDTVFCLAMTNLVKEGDRAPFLQVFAQEGAQHLSLIRGGAMVVPPLQLAQAA